MIRARIRGSTWLMDGKNRLAALLLLIALLVHLAGLAGLADLAVFPETARMVRVMAAGAAVFFLAGLVDIL